MGTVGGLLSNSNSHIYFYTSSYVFIFYAFSAITFVCDYQTALSF